MLQVFPVSFRPTPFVVGRAIGEFSIGQRVLLRKADGLVVEGKLVSLDIHQRVPGEFSFVFSEEISERVAAGDVIYAMECGGQG
ncbi:MAG: hypothetical protein JWN03_7340 [Nocardia sp.]|uniref:hypothetical protein n=1 Tax=Nocardia sp. TaxID=1821 RepID=UPI002617E110|nr:hypothetical protein [Nocardia sp.]MCU1647065.1 hypothetical protein [Nocardia sp.]